MMGRRLTLLHFIFFNCNMAERNFCSKKGERKKEISFVTRRRLLSSMMKEREAQNKTTIIIMICGMKPILNYINTVLMKRNKASVRKNEEQVDKADCYPFH